MALLATNWQSIRKTISNAVISIRNTIKEILEFIPFVDPPKDWDEGTEAVRCGVELKKNERLKRLLRRRIEKILPMQTELDKEIS